MPNRAFSLYLKLSLLGTTLFEISSSIYSDQLDQIELLKNKIDTIMSIHRKDCIFNCTSCDIDFVELHRLIISFIALFPWVSHERYRLTYYKTRYPHLYN